MDDPQQEAQEGQEIAQETSVDDVFRPPSVDSRQILSGASYSYYSDVPSPIASDENMECVLGVDEAGRGPVLGPMVYAVFYLPLSQERPLLVEAHHFDDSKVLTPAVRSSLMQTLCTADSDLYKTCGWATSLLSARDISANMLKPTSAYNLNSQAMDATVSLIQGVLDKRVNVKEIYIDTIGRPETYQKKLERIFPSVRITVAKKADSLYPCVSAASVCAKVTRDAALEACWKAQHGGDMSMAERGWGSGYPSDSRCVGWMRREMDPVFGWGVECRFSWGTVKEMLEVKNKELRVEWPDGRDEDGGMTMTDFFARSGRGRGSVEDDELRNWYGCRVEDGVF